MNKKDFSKQCLAQALFDLLENKRFDEISIQDIVDKAGFSRMAYYRNFNNPTEIIDFYVASFFDKFISESHLSYKIMGAKVFFITLFEFLNTSDTKKIVSCLFKSKMLSHFFNEMVRRSEGGFVANQNEYFYSFVAGGIIGAYLRWIKNNYKESPEEMADIAVNIIKVLKENR